MLNEWNIFIENWKMMFTTSGQRFKRSSSSSCSNLSAGQREDNGNETHGVLKEKQIRNKH